MNIKPLGRAIRRFVFARGAIVRGVTMLWVLVAATAQAQGLGTRAQPFEIPPQDLAAALIMFSDQAGIQVVTSGYDLVDVSTAGVRGTYSPQQALELLLKSTDLRYSVVGESTIALTNPKASPASAEDPKATAVPAEGNAGAASDADVIAGGTDGGGAVATVESARRNGIEEIIVTGQKKEERLQDVPIAISAFSAEQLDAQKIEGGFDLLKAVPNVTFSKSNYSSYNFSIRGVGTKAVSATADPGVAISFNNVPLIRNRLFEQEYFDVERVEVLRGPQGTLYGRNATGGVVNMITNKPDFHEFEGMLKAEAGNYDARRMTAMLNVPIIDDMLALRIAGATTQRDGYGINLTTGKPSDNRDLWSSRLSLGFRPNDRIRANFIWEHFNEDDSRLRTGKQLCHRDEGPETLPGLIGGPLDEFGRGRINQGCKIGSLYDDAAFGRPNGWSLPFTYFMSTIFVRAGYDKPASDPTRVAVPLLRRDRDPYGEGRQSRDLRAIESIIEPKYQAEADIFALNVDIDVSDTLMFSSQTAYNEDYVWSLQDYMRFATPAVFTDTSQLYGQDSDIRGDGLEVRLPGGIYVDPQIGPSETLKGFEVSLSDSEQFSQEFRLQSDFDGPVNFSAGVNYLRFKGINDYYLFFNIVSLIAESFYNSGNGYNPEIAKEVFVDTQPFDSLAGNGHNYYRNQNPYELESRSAFGELYWQPLTSIKVTAGLRYTNDKKTFTPWPSRLLVSNDRGRYSPSTDINLGWNELTGRLGIDWMPDLSFTDQTMIYGFYSRGYKGGGMNPPPAVNMIAGLQAVVPPVFDPEYVNAFEVGAKNTLLGGAMMLNGNAFFYDYRDYQVSKVQDRTIVNENFDAKVWGAELEALWRVTTAATANAAIGYLRTRIGDGERSLDIFNRTQNNPDWAVVAPWVQQTSNCILPVSYIVERVNQEREWAFFDDGWVSMPPGGCYGFWGSDGLPPGEQNPNIALYPAAHAGQGFLADISGNELPNSPRWTFSLGAEYTWDLGAAWALTLRGDYYRQTESWSRVYAEESDRLKGWDNTNFSLTIAQPDKDLALQVYVKNAFNETPITDAFLNSDSTGMTTNVFTLDPRLIGISIRVGF